MKQVIATRDAPPAIGPYSQAIAAGTMIFCSGQIPLDPQTGQLVEGGTAEQTRRVLHNLAATLKAAGVGLEQVVKTTVFLIDMREFGEMNSVYETFFPVAPSGAFHHWDKPLCRRVRGLRSKQSR